MSKKSRLKTFDKTSNYTLSDKDKGIIFIYELLNPTTSSHRYLGKYMGIKDNEYVFESFEQGIKFETSVGIHDDAFDLSRLRAVSHGGTQKYRRKSQKIEKYFNKNRFKND